MTTRYFTESFSRYKSSYINMFYLSYDSSDVIKLLNTTDCSSPNKDD